MRTTTENLSALQSCINDLQLENQVLKQLLEQNGISYRREIQALHAPEKLEEYEINQGARIRHPQMITDAMANHFYARFWGRQDVYSKRSENKKGEAGYYPQCHNFWKEYCPKAREEKISCGMCSARDYKRLQKEDILAHLRGYSGNGSDVIGVYPLLPNGTCRFLVYDFDNHEKGAEKRDFANSDNSWIEEVEAMRTICALNGLDPLVERSRSGRGAHIWLFFDKPISARLVRAFGNALLDRGAEQVNLKSFRYYDRMLPAQEEVPEGGLGNLIALPLQGRALREGNSAFVDENWNAYPDQWKVLWSKPRLSEEFLQLKLKEWAAERLEDVLEERPTDVPADREKPWKWKREFSPQDIAGTLSITLADGIYVDTLKEFCDRFAVIDQELVWYGSMNLLAKEQIEDSMLRVHGKEIAAELLETALGEKGVAGRREDYSGYKVSKDIKIRSDNTLRICHSFQNGEPFSILLTLYASYERLSIVFLESAFRRK